LPYRPSSRARNPYLRADHFKGGGSVTQQYPDVTSHPKPADMDAVVQNLAKLIAKREGETT
jgi:hypothetical protein